MKRLFKRLRAYQPATVGLPAISPFNGTYASPTLCYSTTRSLVPGYSGYLGRIYVINNADEYEVPQLINGMVDEFLISAATGGSDWYWSIIYNQNGLGPSYNSPYDLKQTVIANKPIGGVAGVANRINSRIAMDFQDGVGNRTISSIAPFWDSPTGTLLVVGTPPTTGYDPAGRNIIVNNRYNAGSVVEIRPTYRAYAYSVGTGGTDAIGANNSVVGGTANTTVYDRDGTTQNVYINGNLAATSASTYTANAGTATGGPVLGGQVGARNWRGKIGDIAFWDVKLSAAARIAYENNFRTFYGI